MTNELQILIESSEKKLTVLKSVLKASKEQEELAKADVFDADAFDGLFSQKDELLQTMDELDRGFDSVFAGIQDELLQNASLYKEEIAKLQQLIKEIVDNGAQISATEMRTKDILSHAMERQKQNLAKRKVTSKSVMDYYKTANQLNYLDPYFMDQKK